MEALAIILGTYAITLALTESDGAFGVMYKIRNNKAIKNFGLFECHLCTSFWVAVFLSLAFGMPLMTLIAWGSSVLIDKIVTTLYVK